MASGAVVARILTQYSDKGSKQAQRDIQKLSSRIDAFGKKATKSFAIAGAATAAYAAKVAIDSVKGAAQDEKQQAALATAIRNTTKATDQAIIANNAWLDALELQVGIDNQQLIPALQQLTTATGDLTQGQNLLKLATDVSAASGKDLGQVSMALAKAVNGNFTALSKLGLPLDANAIKTKDLSKLLVQLSRISKGQAAAAANTFAGKLEILRLAINQVKDKVGIALMPALIAFASYVKDKIIPNLEYFVYLNQYKMQTALETTVKNIQDTAHAIGNIYAVIDKVNNILPLGIGGYIQLAAAGYAVGKAFIGLKFAMDVVTASQLKMSLASTANIKTHQQIFRELGKLSPAAKLVAGSFNLIKTEALGLYTSVKTATTGVMAGTAGMGFFATATKGANAALVAFVTTLKGIGAFLAKYVKQIAIALAVMAAIAVLVDKFSKDAVKLSPKAQAIEWNIYKTTVMKGIQSMDDARNAAIKKQEEQNNKTKEQIATEKALAAIEAKNAKDQAKNARAVALRDAVLARLKKLNAVPGTGKAKIGKGITPVSSLDAAEYEAINFRAAELLLLKQKDNEAELKKLAALKENILLQELRNTLSTRYLDILQVIADEKITDAEVKALALGWKLPEQAVRSYLIQFQAVADGTISDDEIVQLAKSWGSTKEQAAQYLDFFAFLNDGVLSDSEIEKLKSKWKLTEDQVRQYADFVGVVNDGKLTDSEVQKLMSKWKMTTDEVVAYIVKIGSPVSYSGTLIDPAKAAEIAWKSATAALDEYLRKLAQGASSSSSSSSSSAAAASADATKEAADAAAAAADAAAALAAANSAATAAALASADAILGTNSGNNYSGDDGIARRAAAAGLATKNAAEAERLAALQKQNDQNAAKAAGLAAKYGGFVGSSTIDNAANMGTSSSNSGTVINLVVNGSVSTEQDLVQTIRTGLLAAQQNGQGLTLQAV